ncbi:hypothetical protein IQ268_31320 [Oculatella sp. LEGE 06141]|uniref:hypothetical protein n=1 Tax=Oculatella sp. LEGE 06141 TaxID=1828648 RepID=UPI001A07CCFA|nr:hypothetical protein [Oculatella sp. LEGE 06141]MBE9183027.1 hypothetical protein [Oculatella sp. LEGE 06141]
MTKRILSAVFMVILAPGLVVQSRSPKARYGLTIRLLLAIAILSVSTAAIGCTNRAYTTATALCEAALHQLAEQDWSHWQGLPPCTVSTVTQVFPLASDAIGLGRVGEQTAHFQMLRVPGYAQPVRLWFTGNEQVLLLDVAYPFSSGLDALLAQWGEPDARLDARWNVVTLPQGEWVYAQRGLALWINPENQVLLHMAAFTPTSLRQYSRLLRLNLTQRRLSTSILPTIDH